MIRAVFDANVFVSSVLSSGGAPGRLLSAWKAGQFDLVASPAIIAEVSRVLRYPKIIRRHGWSEQRTSEFVENLRHHTITTPGLLRLTIIAADPTDDRYLECAVEGKADCIVSGDRHLLDLAVFRGIEILSPREFAAYFS